MFFCFLYFPKFFNIPCVAFVFRGKLNFKKQARKVNTFPVVQILWGWNESFPMVDCNFHTIYTRDLNNENNKTQKGSKVKWTLLWRISGHTLCYRQLIKVHHFNVLSKGKDRESCIKLCVILSMGRKEEKRKSPSLCNDSFSPSFQSSHNRSDSIQFGSFWRETKILLIPT